MNDKPSLPPDLSKSEVHINQADSYAKYNNAKRSIPAHPKFVNDSHRDLHVWTVTSKINRVYHHNL